MNREEYNRFVQRVQEEASAFHMDHRVHPQRASGKNSQFEEGRLMIAEMQVFWNDWQTVAYERFPMSPDTTRHIDEERWERIKAEAAYELARS